MMDADRAVVAEQANQQSDAMPRGDVFALLQIAADDPILWSKPVAHAITRFDINPGARLKMFVAQCAHESRRFTQTRESLHYSSSRLLAVFHNRFSPAEAVEFAYDDVRIGERVYGGRLGNGVEGSGDGYAFRGRGLIQVTGRDNYRECGDAIGVDLETAPQMLELPMHAALSAAWFWQTHGCNEAADRGDFTGITQIINGGLNGYEDRVAWLDKLRAVA